jgi:hypothetical protein
MREITLKPNKFIRNYAMPGREFLYELDRSVILHILEVGSRKKGHLEAIVGEKGCYTQIEIKYDGRQVFCAQETGSGDWWVTWCTIGDHSTLWDFIKGL